MTHIAESCRTANEAIAPAVASFRNAAGLALGAAVSLLLQPLVSGILFGGTATDPLTLVSVSFLPTATALAA